MKVQVLSSVPCERAGIGIQRRLRTGGEVSLVKVQILPFAPCYTRVVELADTLDLEFSAERCAGSNPASCTSNHRKYCPLFWTLNIIGWYLLYGEMSELVEGVRLEIVYTAYNSIQGSNPCLSAKSNTQSRFI